MTIETQATNAPVEGCESFAIQSTIAPLVIGSAALGTALIFQSIFAVLKETPLFWRNAGGWPVELRELILIGFYPALLAELAGLILFTAHMVAEPQSGLRRIRLWSTVVFWIWYAGIVLMVTANNLANTFEGRPLHWHAGY